jgi:superkiller protein 3
MAKPELTEWDEDLTASEKEEYEALVRSLQWAKGFGLLFVQCTPAEGERLMQRVQADIADKTVDVLRLEDEVDDLYETVAALPNISKTNVLFVTGLEKSLVPYIKPGYGSEGDYYAKDSVPKLLGKLNLQREKFRETFGLCFVFLVPPYAMKYLIRRAADFFDWRSGVWEFVGSADEAQQAAQRILKEGDFDEYLSWTPQQRRERILEIDDLLDKNHHSADQISRLRIEQGNICIVDEQSDWAITCYDAAQEIKPDNHKSLYLKGVVMSALGRYEEAIVCYDGALAIKPDAPYLLYYKGIVVGALGRYEEAIACYGAALAIEPDDYEALNNKGIALHNLGRYEEAITSYDAALAIKPDYHEALNNKGIALRNLGRYEEAIACYDAALTIKPDKHDALINKGYALRNLGRYEEAIACYDAALTIKPDKHEALNNKGIALRNLGRYEEAIACYDAALAIKPDYQLAIDNKKDVLEKLTDNSY